MSTTMPASPNPPAPVATAIRASPVAPPATGPSGAPTSAAAGSAAGTTPGEAPAESFGTDPGSGAPVAVTVPGVPTTALSAEDLAAVRAVVLAAHQDTIPELVRGETVADLLASVGPAREAYARVAATVRDPGGTVSAADGSSSSPGGGGVPLVPAGSSPALTIDPDLIPATEKIKRALRR